MVLQQLLLTNEASHSETLVTAFFSNHGHLPVTGSCNFHAWVPAAAGEFPGPALQKRAAGPSEGSWDPDLTRARRSTISEVKLATALGRT